MLKPKVGDMVRLKSFFIESVRGDLIVASGITFNTGAIEEIIPRPLAVGDKVRFHDSAPDSMRAEILAIDGDCAWVRWGVNSRGTQLLSVLRRADDA